MAESELVLNQDGSIYHLSIKEEHVSDTILLVGDQDRVARISRHFDTISDKIQHREFVTHVGKYKGKNITVISTGIGTDNIDIVLNELHATANVDLKARKVKDNLRQLNLIRIGTSGSLQDDIPAGGYIASEYGLGLDGLIYYYSYQPSKEETELQEQINNHLNWNQNLSKPYIIKGSEALLNQLAFDMMKGITATATGFYGPQGRSLGLELSHPTMNDSLRSFAHKDHRITNFEMETSALYGLGKLLGHKCCTCCMVLANRAKKEYVKNAQEAVDGLIETVLDRL